MKRLRISFPLSVKEAEYYDLDVDIEDDVFMENIGKAISQGKSLSGKTISGTLSIGPEVLKSSIITLC